jgi:SAM-dependent methyltransferase
MDPWHDRDDWWESTARAIFSVQAWEIAPQQVEQVLALAGFEPPAYVLDMPCGVGRHALEFARLGCTVTGVDRTEAYLSEAEQHAEKLGLNVEFVQTDMREFRRPEMYDVAINLFTSFGYFEDPDDDVQVLRNFCDSLREGGVLVMDMAGKEILARQFTPRDWSELDDGTLFLEERSIEQDWSWIHNRWILVKDGQCQEYPLDLRLYGASDLRPALEAAGFSSVRFYGDLNGAPYDHEARRLIAVARKGTL